MEEVLLPVMFDVPSENDIARVVITREAVLDNVNPTIVRREAPRVVKRALAASRPSPPGRVSLHTWWYAVQTTFD